MIYHLIYRKNLNTSKLDPLVGNDYKALAKNLNEFQK